ncbi:MAG: hypothetical protein AAGJ70_08640 [Pseudomonadota bacterium]
MFRLPDDDPPERVADRLLACLAGLPKICVVRRCRRHKRCLGRSDGGPPLCLRHHWGLVETRCGERQ